MQTKSSTLSQERAKSSPMHNEIKHFKSFPPKIDSIIGRSIGKLESKPIDYKDKDLIPYIIYINKELEIIKRQLIITKKVLDRVEHHLHDLKVDFEQLGNKKLKLEIIIKEEELVVLAPHEYNQLQNYKNDSEQI